MQKKKYLFFTIAIVLLAFFLRIYAVDTKPHDLYIDEVAIGWNAYSILKAGVDEWNNHFPILFRSYNDYKLPAYMYLTTIFMAILGKNALAVRLPSVLAGTFTVLFFIKIIYIKTLHSFQMLHQPDHRQQIDIQKARIKSLLAGLLLAICPWHLQFSRGGFESNLALFFIVYGIYLMVRDFYAKGKTFFYGVFVLILSLYTYNYTRVFVPILLVFVFFEYKQHVLRIFKRKSSLIYSTTVILTTIPFLIGILFTPQGFARAKSQSFLTEYNLKYGNKIVWSIKKLADNYTDYFSLDFRFFAGDGNGRHSVREMGMHYLWQLPFFIYGIFIAIKSRRWVDRFFIWWWILSPIAATIATPNPHAIRALPLVISDIYFITLGIYRVFHYLRYFKLKDIHKLTMQQFNHETIASSKHYALSTPSKVSTPNSLIHNLLSKIYLTLLPSFLSKLCICLLCLVSLYFSVLYLHIYYDHYPPRTGPDWSDGYKETFTYVKDHQSQYDQVAITTNNPFNYIYLYFYGDFDPKQVAQSSNRFTQFGKYVFVGTPFYAPKNTLFVGAPLDGFDGKLLQTIYNHAHDEVYKIWEN